MPYPSRDPSSSASTPAIAKSYAGVVILALIGLIILNRAFGSVSVSGGIK
jgi:hypothetical protein